MDPADESDRSFQVEFSTRNRDLHKIIVSAYDWQEYNEAMAPKNVATLQMGGLQIHAILPVSVSIWKVRGRKSFGDLK